MKITHGAGTAAGTWARIAGLALCCAIANLLLAVHGVAARSCQLKLVGSTEISAPRDWIVLMQATVNGHPASMELDMASTASEIEAEYVQPLGLRMRGAPVHMNMRSETETFEMTQFHSHRAELDGHGRYPTPLRFR